MPSTTKAALKWRFKDQKLNIVLEDFKKRINEVVDSYNDATTTDVFVKVGADGAGDYLSSSYFQRSIANHITIKNYYDTTAPLAGGGNLSATRTLTWAHLGIENLVDPGVDSIFFWDDGASKSEWLTPDGTTVEIDGTTLKVVAAPVLDEIRLTPKVSSTGPEGTVYYDSDDDHLYVGTE